MNRTGIADRDLRVGDEKSEISLSNLPPPTARPIQWRRLREQFAIPYCAKTRPTSIRPSCSTEARRPTARDIRSARRSLSSQPGARSVDCQSPGDCAQSGSGQRTLGPPSADIDPQAG